jgi:hypothetical protein
MQANDRSSSQSSDFSNPQVHRDRFSGTKRLSPFFLSKPGYVGTVGVLEKRQQGPDNQEFAVPWDCYPATSRSQKRPADRLFVPDALLSARLRLALFLSTP